MPVAGAEAVWDGEADCVSLAGGGVVAVVVLSDGGGVVGPVVEVVVPGSVVVVVSDGVVLVSELVELESLLVEDSEVLDVDELVDVEVEVVDGTVVATVGVPPLTLPIGGRAAIGAPSRAPRMKSVHTPTGTVPPVSSPTPGMLFIWFSGLSDPSPL